MSTRYDAVVIGGGFFGCSIANYLKRRFHSVLLVEQEDGLCLQASYANQARIHNGYHYPRSLSTAYRSRINFQAFITEFPECVVKGFKKLYCVAAQNSKVTPQQFERFCTTIGAPWKVAAKRFSGLFDSRRIAAVYEVTEHAFDIGTLKEILSGRLKSAGVEIRFRTKLQSVETVQGSSHLRFDGGDEVDTTYLFNCTYAGLKQVPGLREHCRAELKYEIAEMPLIEPPEELRDVGVTVMCGPFFSTMPFPARPGLHTLSHVRYTPHCSWSDQGSDGRAPNPYDLMKAYSKQTNGLHMMKDAQRYLPVLGRSRILDSLFAVKTLLVRNEFDDGRPILVERSASASNIFSIMGGKVDNIYDVFQRLAAEGI